MKPPCLVIDTEHTKNVRDWKEVFDFLTREPTFIPVDSDEHDDQVLLSGLIHPLNSHQTSEHTKNVRDWKEVIDFVATEPTFVPVNSDEHDDQVTQWTNPSPPYPPNFRVIFQDNIQEVEKLAYKLLELIALSLDLEARGLKNFSSKIKPALLGSITILHVLTFT